VLSSRHLINGKTKGLASLITLSLFQTIEGSSKYKSLTFKSPKAFIKSKLPVNIFNVISSLVTELITQ